MKTLRHAFKGGWGPTRSVYFRRIRSTVPKLLVRVSSGGARTEVKGDNIMFFHALGKTVSSGGGRRGVKGDHIICCFMHNKYLKHRKKNNVVARVGGLNAKTNLVEVLRYTRGMHAMGEGGGEGGREAAGGRNRQLLLVLLASVEDSVEYRISFESRV